MSLYGDYILEKDGKRIIESEYGFATFTINKGECYIENIYVVPDKRKSNIASKMADEIVIIAKDNNCSYLTGSVKPSANGSTDSVRVLLAYGFSVLSSDKDAIFFVKEI